MFVFREEVYKPDDPELRARRTIIIAKQRNGPTGDVDAHVPARVHQVRALQPDDGGRDRARLLGAWKTILAVRGARYVQERGARLGRRKSGGSRSCCATSCASCPGAALVPGASCSRWVRGRRGLAVAGRGGEPVHRRGGRGAGRLPVHRGGADALPGLGGAALGDHRAGPGADRRWWWAAAWEPRSRPSSAP